MRRLIRAALFILLGTIVLTPGCSSPFVENNTIEEIAPVIFWSINEGKEQKLKISTLAPPLIKEKKRLLTLQVDMQKQGGKEFRLKYYRELKAGQLRILLINEDMAKKGILTLINPLLTDPDISQRLYLVIVRGIFEDYIQKQLNQQATLDYFLYQMFKHYETHNQGEMSIVNLHQFKHKLYSPYADPVLPVFKVKNENFTYEGTSFFRNDKLTATVNKMEDQIFQMIDNDYYLKLFAIPALSVTLGHARSKVQRELSRDYSSFSIKVDLSGRIEEYRGDKNLEDPKNLAALQNEIEKYLEENTTKLMKKLQKKKVDPLEIGTLTLKPWAKPLSEKQWRDYWEQMKINVDYKVHLQIFK